MRRRTVVGLGAVVAGLSFAGSCDQRGLGDAPVGDAYEAPRAVIVMPDEFPNLVVACDGPVRVYVTTREAPPVVVNGHPACHDAELITDQGRRVEYDQGDEQ